MKRKYTDPVDGPTLDEHPEIEVEEVPQIRARRKRSATTSTAYNAENVDDSAKETDWADRTSRDVTAKGDTRG